jgi:hypothetical protein
MNTVWVSDQATKHWLGNVIVDVNEVIERDDAEHIIAALVSKGLAPPPSGRWNVNIQRLPADAGIPDSAKGRLITDAAEATRLGGAFTSTAGAN